jgi:hypothetical protein
MNWRDPFDVRTSAEQPRDARVRAEEVLWAAGCLPEDHPPGTALACLVAEAAIRAFGELAPGARAALLHDAPPTLKCLADTLEMAFGEEELAAEIRAAFEDSAELAAERRAAREEDPEELAAELRAAFGEVTE